MGRRTILVDDFDGSELPEDTAPVTFSLGRTTYSLYLSEKNYGKFMDAVTPFIEKAETVSGSTGSSRSRRSSSSNTDKETLKAIRAWAQSANYLYKNAKGEDVTLGDRGRIPQDVIDAYHKANA